MTIQQSLLAIPVFLFTFLAIDLLWLNVFATEFYKSRIGFLYPENFNLVAAGIFYLIYALGVCFFIISSNINTARTLHEIALRAAFLGFLCYATYDLTNLVTIKDWPVSLVIVDMIWGSLLTGTATFVTALTLRGIFKI